MRFNKITLVCACVSVLAALPVAAQNISIGFYGPLTGPMSLSGIASKQGADLAIKQINAQGGVIGRKLVLVPYDDKSSPEEAVKGVTRMISSDKVQCIVGSLHSGNILASAPVVEKAKVPEIGIGTSPAGCRRVIPTSSGRWPTPISSTSRSRRPSAT